MNYSKDDKTKTKLYKLFQKAMRLYTDEKWDKASEIFKKAGYLANQINDKTIESDCIEYIEKCMINLQEKIDKEKEELENSFSKLYE